MQITALPKKNCLLIFLLLLALASGIGVARAAPDSSGEMPFASGRLSNPGAITPGAKPQASHGAPEDLATVALNLMGRHTDNDGDVLDGSNAYVVEIPDEPPPDAEWSLTIYKVRDKQDLRDGLPMEEIGAITHAARKSLGTPIRIPIRAASTQGPATSASLPAPEGNFYLVLRIRQVSRDTPETDFEPPQIWKTK